MLATRPPHQVAQASSWSCYRGPPIPTRRNGQAFIAASLWSSPLHRCVCRCHCLHHTHTPRGLAWLQRAAVPLRRDRQLFVVMQGHCGVGNGAVHVSGDPPQRYAPGCQLPPPQDCTWYSVLCIGERPVCCQGLWWCSSSLCGHTYGSVVPGGL